MADTPKLRIANTVLLDARTGDVYIDGEPIGVYIDQDWTVERLDSSFYCVGVGIFAERFMVMRTLEEDLAYIRRVANRHRRELGLPEIDEAGHE